MPRNRRSRRGAAAGVGRRQILQRHLQTLESCCYGRRLRGLRPGCGLQRHLPGHAPPFCPRRWPHVCKDAGRTHAIAYGECLGGALYWNDFKRLARNAGFNPNATSPSIHLSPPTCDLIAQPQGFLTRGWWSAEKSTFTTWSCCRCWVAPDSTAPLTDFGKLLLWKMPARTMARLRFITALARACPTLLL